MVFDVGDNRWPGHADEKIHAFGCALRHLRSQILVKSLHIRLAYHAFKDSAQLSDFASALNKTTVLENLTITGDEKVLDMSFGDLPSKLGMDMMPVYSLFQAYDSGIQYSPGSFLFQYSPGKRVGENTDPWRKHLITDPKHLS